jgi:phospholipid:diacylglycerol acyltransferase
MGEGDGTVSLLSLGAMCVEGWKRERWNPAGIKITTVEVRVFRVLFCQHSLTR